MLLGLNGAPSGLPEARRRLHVTVREQAVAVDLRDNFRTRYARARDIGYQADARVGGGADGRADFSLKYEKYASSKR